MQEKVPYNQLYDLIRWFDPNDQRDRIDVLMALQELAPLTTVENLKKLWLQLCKEYHYEHSHTIYGNGLNTYDGSSLPVPNGANIDY